MRKQIKDLEKQIDLLKVKKAELINEYIETEKNYIYISDHALVRYIERVENILLLGETDEEKLTSYPGYLKEFRKKVMPRSLQIKILEEDKGWIKEGNLTYIVKNLTLITIIKKGK